MLQVSSGAGGKRLGDVEMRDHHANVLKPISTDSVGKGRSKLSYAQKQEVEKIIGQKLKSLGYLSCIS